MSQVTEQSVRFQTALASIKLIQASAVLDLTEDDFDFLTSNKVWIATDRSRARRCVERSEERRVGKEGRSRRSRDHQKKKPPDGAAPHGSRRRPSRRTAGDDETAPTAASDGRSRPHRPRGPRSEQ